MTLIRTEKLSKVFKDRSLPVTALSSIDLKIGAGEFVALSGPSGSGKTTLLNLIGCLDRPSSGAVFFDSEDVSKLSQQKLTRFRLRSIGFVFQDFNLIPTFTAMENIEYVLWLQGISGAERRKRSLEVCKRFSIEKLTHRRPVELSRGQQQRVAVARAIVHKPKIVLGDELTANLDHKTGVELMDFLKDLNHRERMTFVYASHDPVMVERASRVIQMQDGAIYRDGTPEKNPERPNVYQ